MEEEQGTPRIPRRTKAPPRAEKKPEPAKAIPDKAVPGTLLPLRSSSYDPWGASRQRALDRKQEEIDQCKIDEEESGWYRNYRELPEQEPPTEPVTDSWVEALRKREAARVEEELSAILLEEFPGYDVFGLQFTPSNKLWSVSAFPINGPAKEIYEHGETKHHALAKRKGTHLPAL